VDRDEVGLGEQLLQPDQAHAELGRAGRLDVRVVGDEPGAERRDPLGEEHADAAQPDHADGLALQLDAGVLGTLPLPGLQRGRGGGGVAGDREQQGECLFRRGDDVRGGGIDDHDTAGGGGRHVDVVEADAGPRDHPQLRGGGDRLGVDVGGAAHDDGVRVGQGGEQGRPVGSVDMTDVEVVGQHVDGGGSELFGDEDNGGHDVFPHGWWSGTAQRSDAAVRSRWTLSIVGAPRARNAADAA
jgi:hypothetical protein